MDVQTIRDHLAQVSAYLDEAGEVDLYQMNQTILHQIERATVTESEMGLLVWGDDNTERRGNLEYLQSKMSRPHGDEISRLRTSKIQWPPELIEED